MNRQKNVKLMAALCTLFFIALALVCKVEAKVFIYSFYDKFLNLVRIFIYLGLLFSWCASVRKRVIQTQIKTILSVIAAAMGFWLIVREFKFRYILNQDVIRYLWYSYYIPLIMIPLLALFVAMSLGKSEAYKLPRWTRVFYLPAVLLIGLVFTNDFHQLVFRFPADSATFSELNYSYAPVAVVIVVFEFSCSIASLMIMAHKARHNHVFKSFLIPFLPLGFGIAYLIMYALRAPLFTGILGDFAVVFCLVYAAFFESCIHVGLMHSNEHYFDLFKACEGIVLVITNRRLERCYQTGGGDLIQDARMPAALEQPQLLADGAWLHGMVLDGGYAFWQEDVSELMALKQTLEDRKEELEERKAFLELEYQKEKEHKTVEEQNRLYDLLQRKTQTQLDEIDRLMGAYKAERDEGKKKRILAKIVVLGTFIKRRKNFVLSAYASPVLPEAMLTRAFDESFKALKLLHIEGSFSVNTGYRELGSDSLSLAYDFFESVCEAVLETAGYFNVVVSNIHGKVRVNVICDTAPENPRALLQQYPAVQMDSESGETRFMLRVAGGEAK